jgi:curved DNA-binding protein CbpA
VSNTDDYYDLIGVSPDADRNTIREAYRARRAELGDDENGRAAAAKLNRAWNVLSDTRQRERYDEALASARVDGETVVPDDIESPNGNGTRPLTRGQQRRQRFTQQQTNRGNRPARQPVQMLTEINGVPLASVRDRMFALVVDGIIAFLLLYIGGFLVAVPAWEKSQQPKVVDTITHLVNAQDTAQKQIDHYSNLRKDLKNPGKTDPTLCKQHAQHFESQAQQYLCQQKLYENHFDALGKRVSKQQSKLTGTAFQAFAACALVALLIFAVPTALTGKSPGKALRKIKLVKDDAVTPVGWGTAFLHYGVTLGFIVASFSFGQLATIAWIVVVFGVSSFTRNAKRQGWDNRISHTVVVPA